MPPALADLPAQKARYLTGRAVPRHMLGNESFQQLIDAIGHNPLLRGSLFSGGIASLKLRRENPLRSHAGLMKGDTPEHPDGVFPQARSGATCPVNDDKYFATFWCNLHAKARATGVPVASQSRFWLA
jgi:hypothetical protein